VVSLFLDEEKYKANLSGLRSKKTKRPELKGKKKKNKPTTHYQDTTHQKADFARKLFGVKSSSVNGN